MPVASCYFEMDLGDVESQTSCSAARVPQLPDALMLTDYDHNAIDSCIGSLSSFTYEQIVQRVIEEYEELKKAYAKAACNYLPSPPICTSCIFQGPDNAFDVSRFCFCFTHAGIHESYWQSALIHLNFAANAPLVKSQIAAGGSALAGTGCSATSPDASAPQGGAACGDGSALDERRQKSMWARDERQKKLLQKRRERKETRPERLLAYKERHKKQMSVLYFKKKQAKLDQQQ